MTCGELTHRLPEYWANELSSDQHRELDAHLASCATCRDEARALSELWTALGELKDEAPVVSLRAGSSAAGALGTADAPQITFGVVRGTGGSERARAPERGGRRVMWSPRLHPVWQAAAALLLAAAGFAAGRAWPNAAHTTVLAEMRGELHGMRQMVALSLLRQESASDRLRGVTWSATMAQPGTEVIGALVDTLQHDGNVNVRLAAIEALRQYGTDSRVREALVRALPTDPSPLVQIALIDTMVALKERRSAEALRALSDDAHANESVRQRARRGLRQIL